VTQDPITDSLERAADIGGDLTPLVYARLFARHPEFEALFLLDPQGQVRGSMLANAIEAILDIAGPQRYGLSLVRAERATHEAYGVDPAAYASFFAVIRDTVRDVLGENWDRKADAAWGDLLARVEAGLRSR
jgi:hemoglobin-like flavoprotein